MKKTLDVNICNVKSMAESGQLKQFAVFIYLKSLYRNSCILNYTQQSLASKSGMSVGSVKKHVNYFLSAGWCRTHRTSLVFNKLRSFDQNKKKIIIKFKIKDNVKHIFEDLCLELLKHKQRQFKKLSKIRADLNNPYPKTRRLANRKLDRLGLKVGTLPGAGSMLTLSMKSIAEILGVSVGWACQFIKKLKTRGKILCITSRNVVTGYLPAVKSMSGFSNTYIHAGQLFLVQCNKYKF